MLAGICSAPALVFHKTGLLDALEDATCHPMCEGLMKGQKHSD